MGKQRNNTRSVEKGNKKAALIGNLENTNGNTVLQCMEELVDALMWLESDRKAMGGGAHTVKGKITKSKK